MKTKINFFLLIIILIILYNEINMNNMIICDFFIIDNSYTLKNVLDNNFNYAIDPRKSEVLNCLYISRYMGQDWNKAFFYFDHYGNLSDYCLDLIKYVKDELRKENINLENNSNYEQILRQIYYNYMNEFILYTRECIEITGEGDLNKCDYIQKLIEQHTEIKKNMCLENVDNPLCNQKKIENNKKMLDGYFDQNMRNFGRDYYSKERNYKIEKPEDDKTLIIGVSMAACIGIGYLIYKLYS